MNRDDARNLVRSLPALLSGSQPEPTGLLATCLRGVGEELLAILREAFEAKSRGFTDAAGLTWEKGKGKPKPEKQTGITSGRLLASLTPGHADNTLEAAPGKVKAGTALPYAEHFAKARPLAPEGPFPQVWEERLGKALSAAVTEFLKRKGAG